MATTFMFATGIDSSAPTAGPERTRRDHMRACGHDEHWRTDLALAQAVGARYLRYGVPLYRTWHAPGSYDWSFADAAYGEMRRLGIVPMAELCRFGVPDWVGDFQNPEFPKLFADYACAFAQRYHWIQFYTPVAEMYTCAVRSALDGAWNEQLRGDAAFVRALEHLARANMLAMRAILAVRPDALFVQSESTAYCHAGEPEAIPAAERLNGRRFLSLDLTYGHHVDSALYEYLMDHGMSRENYHDFMARSAKAHCIVGCDSYPGTEIQTDAAGATSPAGELYGFGLIAREFHRRYQMPLMLSETSSSSHPADWMRRQWAHVLALAHDGIPVVGFTWYPLLGQEDGGLAGTDRRLRPVGEAYRKLIATWRDTLPVQSHALRIVEGPDVG
ncbi:MAG: glycoside hydrolase family 1 protein [Telluria sp.]